MGFEKALLDLQILTSENLDKLKEALELLEEGDEEGAIEVIKDALEFAVWDTAFINNLPDSSFAVISPGGSKDNGGKTVPRSLRHLPYKDTSGKVDLPHLRNALARLAQTNISSNLKSEARQKLESAAKSAGVGAPAEKAASEAFAEGWTTGIELDEHGKPIQIIKTGTFQHPQRGKITIREADLKEMVKHFNAQVRGQQIPVDIDHKHELGAVGWFKALDGPKQIDGGHALFATIDWTLEGENQIKGGAFKYFSPHFGQWVDPETKKEFDNVLLSGAITNFPFLKGMQPISFHEFKEGTVGNVTQEEFKALKDEVGTINANVGKTSKSVEDLTTKLSDSLVADSKRRLTERVSGASELSDDEKKELVEEIKASDLSEEDKGSLVKILEAPPKGEGDKDKDKDNPALSELRTEFKGREEGLQKQLTEAQSEIKLIRREKRTVQFMELITGKRGDDPPWVGDVDSHIKLMESIADNQGEDSEELKSYITIQSAHAKQIADSALLSEIGTSGGGPVTEIEGLELGVKKLMETDNELTLAEATSKFLATPEGQKFYGAYDRAQRVRAAKDGG